DGRPDVVAVVPDLSAAYSFLGTPTGLGPASYQSIAGATPPGSGSSAALAVGDITGDHTDDVVISVATNKNVVLLLDNGTATLALASRRRRPARTPSPAGRRRRRRW